MLRSWSSHFDSVSLNQHQLWKLLGGHFFYSSSAEFLIGSILLYKFMILERHWGTWKFCSLYITATTLSNLIDFVVLLIINDKQKHLNFGPYGFIFALAWHYLKNIPLVEYAKFFGIQISNKLLLGTLLLHVIIL